MIFNREQILKLKKEINIEDFYTGILGKEIVYNSNPNMFHICCPFHEDSNPSFTIMRDSGFWRCWSEAIYGDIIEFYSRFFGKTFSQSVLDIAKQFNIDIELSEEMKYQLKFTEAVHSLNKKVSKFYTNNLIQNLDAKKYLKSRNLLDSKTVGKWGIGYTGNYKLNSIFPKFSKLLFMSNLAYENGNNYFSDKRISIPFHDDYGNIIGFTTRAIDSDVKPKYLHSKSSDIFNKSEILFGYCFAKDTIKKYKNVIICEGQIDCIRAHQYGIENCVAICGNALTDQHVNKIKNHVRTYYIVVEDDKFEKDRLDKTYETIIKNNYWAEVKVVKLYDKDKCDLDDYLETYGKQSFLDLVANAPTYYAYKLRDLISNINYKTIEDKKKQVYKCRKYLKELPLLERKEYIQTIANVLELPVGDIYTIINREEEKNIIVGKYDDRITLSQKMIIASLFSKFSNTRGDFAETLCLIQRLGIEEYLDENFKKIYEIIINLYLQNTNNCDIINTISSEDIDKELLDIIVDCYFKNDEFEGLDDYKELELFLLDMLENLK